MESQFFLWLLWALCWPDLMTTGAACSLVPCLQCQPLGKSTIIGQPLRLQGLAGEWEGTQLDLYPSALTYRSLKISPTSACQSVGTWEEITFHCPETFPSRCRSWTEKRGLEWPFKILLRCLVWGTVDSRGAAQKAISCCAQRMLNNFSSWVHPKKASLWARKWRNLWFCLPQPAEIFIYNNINDDFIIINH